MFEAVGGYYAGNLDEAGVEEYEENACPTCGSCSGMYTANSMNCLTEEARHVLVAVGNHHQPVKLMGQGHGLGGVGDEIPGDQGVFHHQMEIVGSELRKNMIWGGDSDLDTASN